MITTSQYKDYKDSGIEWIGEIPRHWISTPLKHLCSIENGKEFNSIQVESGGYPVYGTGGEFSRCSEFLYHGPSVLLGRKGTIDKPILVYEPFWTSDTIYYTVIKSMIKPEFMFYQVCQIPFSLFSYGSTIPSMTKSHYENMRFPLPPLSEQEQIVSYLDEKTSLIDEMVEKKKRKIELLKEYRTSLINTVVTKGLNPDVPMKDSGIEWIGEIPRHWVVKKLTHITELVNCGYTSTPDYYDEGIMFLSGQNVKNGKIDYSKFNYISPDLHIELTKRIKPIIGDLLVVRVGGSSNIGMSCVVDTDVDFSIYVSLTLVRFYKDSCNSYYYNYTFNNERFRQYCLVETKTGGGVGNLNVKDFERFQFPLPPLSEQEQIVSYLDEKTSEIDKTIELENKKIELLKEYRQSLISNVVTGKIKVVSE